MRKYYSTMQYTARQIRSFEVDPGTMGAVLHFHGVEETVTVDSNFMFRNNPRPFDFYVECPNGYPRVVRADDFNLMFRLCEEQA